MKRIMIVLLCLGALSAGAQTKNTEKSLPATKQQPVPLASVDAATTGNNTSTSVVTGNAQVNATTINMVAEPVSTAPQPGATDNKVQLKDDRPYPQHIRKSK